mgnify:CR=1 FL=1
MEEVHRAGRQGLQARLVVELGGKVRDVRQDNLAVLVILDLCGAPATGQQFTGTLKAGIRCLPLVALLAALKRSWRLAASPLRLFDDSTIGYDGRFGSSSNAPRESRSSAQKTEFQLWI